jgi:hypothetical protein
MSSHIDLDRRSLAMHQMIAEKIRQTPALFNVALDNVQRWKAMAAGDKVPSYLTEWEHILKKGQGVALAKATEASEDATRLRQSTPFAGVLQPKERWEFLRKWKESSSNT